MFYFFCQCFFCLFTNPWGEIRLPNINQEIYNKPDVVRIYTEQTGLDDVENFFLTHYVKPGSDILDIGVGGGRTTSAFSSDANSYVGIDYSEEMVKACLNRFPDKKFLTLDASSMKIFNDESFDIVIFSFNGIDYLPDWNSRIECINEIKRVLRPGGHFFFSSHNSRGILFPPNFTVEGWGAKFREFIKSIYKTIRFASKYLCQAAFYVGHGFIKDPTHGGLWTHVSLPKFVVQDLTNCGFKVLCVKGKTVKPWLTMGNPWYYYICQK
ncbi:MAG: hypothetical protein C0412_01615 [Flavobacterium sp.]|nr:hypothetical protein [Flavobacterium sp.]